MTIKILKNIFAIFKSKNTHDPHRLVYFSHNNFWSRFFIFTVTSLVVIVLLAIWGANFLEQIIDPVRFAKNTQVIVEIYPENSLRRTESKQQIVLNYLNNNPNVVSIKVVDQKDLRALLQGWSSVLNDLSNLPLPTILNVTLKKNGNFNSSDLQLALSQQVKDVYVDNQQNLANKLTGTLNISRGLLLIIPIILFFIIFGIVLFVTLGLVYAHRRTIEVLSFLGASYLDIAKEFSMWIFKRAFKGCFIGLAFTFILVEIMVFALNWSWFVWPSQFSLLLMLLVFIIIPLEATCIAFFVVKKIISWMI